MNVIVDFSLDNLNNISQLRSYWALETMLWSNKKQYWEYFSSWLIDFNNRNLYPVICKIN